MKAFIGMDLLKRLPNMRTDVRDTKLPGFLIRCRASGVHSYAVSLGRGRLFTLGRVGVLQPEEAREHAREALMAPSDPIAARRARRAVPRYATFIADTYTPWARQHLRSWEETLRRLMVSFKAFDSLALIDITPFAVERWRTARLKSGASPSTVNRDLDTLKAALARAVDWHLLTAHQIESVKRLRLDRRLTVRFLNDDELLRLAGALDAINGLQNAHIKPLVLLALHTGMRRGELLTLTWRDLAGGQLTIRGAHAKSGQTRIIPLNSEIVPVLEAWRPAHAKPLSLVFPGLKGRRMHDTRTAFANVLAAAGIQDFRFHDLRHTFASRLIQKGVALYVVSQLLGHSTTRMTERYAHLAPEHHQAAVETLVRVG